MKKLQLDLTFSSILLFILAITFIYMAIRGGMENYVSVPLGDMWDGYIEFYRQVQDGGLSVWWAQHNEHRILLSRLLFWLDLTAFKGSGVILIFINYILATCIAGIFFLILKAGFKGKKNQLLICYSFFILAFSFSWIQMENLIWGFQSQFFLVFLLPLIAFYNLYQSSLNEKDIKFFLISCIVGTCSAGTMVNGVLTLPLMIVLSVVLKLNKKKTICLSVLSCVVLFLYFYDYRSIGYHASPLDSIFHHPLEFLEYFFLYLGGPFYYLTGGSQPVGEFAGVFILGSSIYWMYKNFKNKNSSSLQWILLAFIFYILLTVIATAGGRLGISSSVTSRYMTPALMAWSALFILYTLNLRSEYKVAPILVLTLWMLLPWQERALISAAGSVFEQKLSALALQMQIKDQKQIPCVYGGVDRALSLSKFAIQNSLGIFGSSPFKEVGQSIGQISPSFSEKRALGLLDEIESIEGNSSFVRVKGWIYELEAQKVPPLIRIVDQENKIVGYALTGKKRSDLKKTISDEAQYAGFAGYLLSEYGDKQLIFRGIDPDCQFVVEPSHHIKT